MNHYKILKYLATGLILLATFQTITAQPGDSLTLQKAIDMALQNNHLLNIKKIEVKEKKSKVAESRIKALPMISISSTLQYNQNLAELTIPEGSFGSIPLSAQLVIPLPNQDMTFELSQHETFNAAVTLYQPLTQLGKIKAGIDVSKTDVNIAEQETRKASQQIRQAVEKLYYGLLINQKNIEEANAKIELAKMKLHDVEAALESGKTIDVNKAGLMANIADEEQNLLKLQIEAEDYTADLNNLTGLNTDNLVLSNVEFSTPKFITTTATEPLSSNSDLKIAELNQQKAKQAVKAARLNYLPDLGFIAGYSYQTGNNLYPGKNPFVGANFKWNLQDIFSNRQQVNQRNFLLEQASENVINTREQVTSEIEKAHRKINQSVALINVAQKAVTYREEELKIEYDKQVSGLNTKTDLLDAQALLAKARANLLAAQLNYRLACSDLTILTGEE